MTHAVHFFDQEAVLADLAGAFLAEAVRTDGSALIVSTPTRVAAFGRAMALAGVDTPGGGSVLAVDAGETLAGFMTPDGPDAARFETTVGGLVRAAGAGGRPVRVYGDMVAMLWESGDVTGALQLESLWNDLADKASFSLLCGYSVQAVSGAEHEMAVQQVCRLHASVVGRGSRFGSNGRAEEKAERAFERSFDAPREARRFVVETLHRWERGELADTTALVVSELAANAVVHARSDFVMTLRLKGDNVEVSLRDSGPLLPELREATATAENGRGLGLVASLSKAWGHRLGPDGKVVWAEIGK